MINRHGRNVPIQRVLEERQQQRRNLLQNQTGNTNQINTQIQGVETLPVFPPEGFWETIRNAPVNDLGMFLNEHFLTEPIGTPTFREFNTTTYVVPRTEAEVTPRTRIQGLGPRTRIEGLETEVVNEIPVTIRPWWETNNLVTPTPIVTPNFREQTARRNINRTIPVSSFRIGNSSRKRAEKLKKLYIKIMACGTSYIGKAFSYVPDNKWKIGKWIFNDKVVAEIDLTTLKLSKIILPEIGIKEQNLVRFLWRQLGIIAVRYKNVTSIIIGNERKFIKPGEILEIPLTEIKSYIDKKNIDLTKIQEQGELFDADSEYGEHFDNKLKLKLVNYVNYEGRNIKRIFNFEPES